MKKIVFILAYVCCFLAVGAQSTEGDHANKEIKKIIIRLDDIGMCHASNMGAKAIFEKGFPVSASIMTACPWFNEAAQVVKQYPNVSVGIHLTLNSEWENYKWGPVLGRSVVPSLVDSAGFFTDIVTWYFKDIFKLAEMEKELRAQIEKAINAGLKIDYLDGHMGACEQSEDQIKLLEKLAKDYGVGLSGYFSENNLMGVDGYAKTNGSQGFDSSLESVKPGLTLIVSHPGTDTPEMQALKQKGGKDIAKERQLVSTVLSSPKFLEIVKKNNIQLVNYKMEIAEYGLNSMKRK